MRPPPAQLERRDRDELHRDSQVAGAFNLTLARRRPHTQEKQEGAKAVSGGAGVGRGGPGGLGEEGGGEVSVQTRPRRRSRRLRLGPTGRDTQ